MTDSCLFCRIVRKEIPSVIVMENEHMVAFRDIDPKAPTHVVIVPRAHIASLDEATDGEMLGELMLAAGAVARTESISQSGYRTVVNSGANGGQTVFHLHVHVLGGRQMKWPPG